MVDAFKQLIELIDSIGPKPPTLYFLCTRLQAYQIEQATGEHFQGEVMLGPAFYLRFYPSMEIFISEGVPTEPGKILKINEGWARRFKDLGVYYPELRRHVSWDTHIKINLGEIDLETLKKIS